MVPEERVLLVADLDRAATILRQQSAHRHPLQHQPPSPTCGINTLSPGCTLTCTRLPSLSRPPGPTASTLASFSSLTALSGRKMPPAVLASAFIRWTSTRSRRGARDLMDLTARDWEGGQ